MIALSPEAEAQVDRLIGHYEAKERRQAALNLLHALERAAERIAAAPAAGLPAPPVISAVFYVTADIPNRI